MATKATVQITPGGYSVTRPANPKDVMELIEKEGIRIVDLRFTDLPGLWQHFSITLPEITPDLFTEGIGFDGSSIRGFQEIHESDMLLKPDPSTAFIDPMCQVPTLAIICDVVDPVLKQPYTRDPRFIARKAEKYLQDIRSEIVLALMQAGIQVEVHHHEVATAGQNEIDMKFAPLTRMADNVMMYKNFCK